LLLKLLSKAKDKRRPALFSSRKLSRLLYPQDINLFIEITPLNIEEATVSIKFNGKTRLKPDEIQSIVVNRLPLYARNDQAWRPFNHNASNIVSRKLFKMPLYKINLIKIYNLSLL
jgi:hypothetical protein